MLLKADALPGHLRSRSAGGLAPIYVVAGDEPLLAIEALDAIRTAARTGGYSERDVLHADARFDWSRLTQAAAGLSLFADRRIVELRLPAGKPGKAGSEALRELADGSEALRELAEDPPPDVLTLISLPRLDRETRSSKWAAALQQAAVWIDIERVERAALPEWIAARLARNRQRAPREALEFIADRVEGNLLAAHQEIEKLALLHPEGALTPTACSMSPVTTSSRWPRRCSPATAPGRCGCSKACAPRGSPCRWCSGWWPRNCARCCGRMRRRRPAGLSPRWRANCASGVRASDCCRRRSDGCPRQRWRGSWRAAPTSTASPRASRHRAPTATRG